MLAAYYTRTPVTHDQGCAACLRGALGATEGPSVLTWISAGLALVGLGAAFYMLSADYKEKYR